MKKEMDGGAASQNQSDQDAALRQCDELVRLFHNLAPESRKAVMQFVQDTAAREVAMQNQRTVKSESKAREEKVLEEWTDEQGATFRIVESDDGLTPSQRRDAVAKILATIALRVMKERKISETCPDAPLKDDSRRKSDGKRML